jgi:predicted component of type VI protein secretion system
MKHTDSNIPLYSFSDIKKIYSRLTDAYQKLLTLKIELHWTEVKLQEARDLLDYKKGSKVKRLLKGEKK